MLPVWLLLCCCRYSDDVRSVHLSTGCHTADVSPAQLQLQSTSLASPACDPAEALQPSHANIQKISTRPQLSQPASCAGVGAYTAAAIASIVFSDQAAAVDGNVIRVVSRLRALAGGQAAHMGIWAVWCTDDLPQATRALSKVVAFSRLGHGVMRLVPTA